MHALQWFATQAQRVQLNLQSPYTSAIWMCVFLSAVVEIGGGIGMGVWPADTGEDGCISESLARQYRPHERSKSA